MKILKSLSLTLLLALPLAVSAAPRPATPFTDAELDAMLAPIALYPDSVLSHVLIAATVPEDVEAAADWVYGHPDRRGQEAVDAVDRYDWDPSVKALVAFPEVIERMDEDPDWTEDLGLAFLEQEQAVMDRVQVLRDRAYDNGSLDDIEHVRVVREREYIYIEPAVARVVYVPYYNPLRVYGHWWWASYPPHCWNWWAGRPAHYYYGSSFHWGVSYHLGPTWYVGAFNWPRRHVVVTRPHRHYAPSPGYSGGSMRRDVVRHEDTRRLRHGSAEWRHDPRSARPAQPQRPSTTVRRGQDRRDDVTRVRRSWTEVRDALAARRNDSTRTERTVRAGVPGEGTRRRVDAPGRDPVVRSGERTRPDSRRQDDRPRAVRAPQVPRTTRPAPRPEREVRAVEREPERSTRPAPQPRVESRPAPQPSVESRPASRAEPAGGGRSAGSQGGSRGRGDGGGSRTRSR